MTQVEQIQEQPRQLPHEKQREVLDFVSFLQQQLTAAQQRLEQRPLRQRPAFGSWRGRKVNALNGLSEADAEYGRYERAPNSRNGQAGTGNSQDGGAPV